MPTHKELIPHKALNKIKQLHCDCGRKYLPSKNITATVHVVMISYLSIKISHKVWANCHIVF